MKKLLFLFLFLIFSSLSVNAETILGTALTDFSTDNPKEYFTVKINESFTVDNLQTYKEGTVFYGKVIKVSNGQIGKRKGYFIFVPTHVSAPNDSVKYNQNHTLIQDGIYKLTLRNLKIKVSYYKPFDKEQALKNLANVGMSVAASQIFHIPMLTEGISFIKGAINPDEDTNRIVSGVKSAYNSSPLAYAGKGESLIIFPGQEIKLNIDNY